MDYRLSCLTLILLFGFAISKGLTTKKLTISVRIQPEVTVMWKKPSYRDLRIGFEVTMYFSHR
ncbi:coenzyme PQQ precursor peptide PqqA [Oceanospirillum multiglobuliferum]|uniref:Coenzyme PQQ synthesis protein A n=1 Tax=Oceanospirillum multiglobuliferum TaxID=64969 RepID=A0A1V4T1G9_9GAMM|nr:coenzyme PQQ precursor peptide PqqA [Oceanospirillum multiglobuliferum]